MFLTKTPNQIHIHTYKKKLHILLPPKTPHGIAHEEVEMSSKFKSSDKSVLKNGVCASILIF